LAVAVAARPLATRSATEVVVGVAGRRSESGAGLPDRIRATRLLAEVGDVHIVVRIHRHRPPGIQRLFRADSANYPRVRFPQLQSRSLQKLLASPCPIADRRRRIGSEWRPRTRAPDRYQRRPRIDFRARRASAPPGEHSVAISRNGRCRDYIRRRLKSLPLPEQLARHSACRKSGASISSTRSLPVIRDEQYSRSHRARRQPVGTIA